jgi:hypothetical protein
MKKATTGIIVFVVAFIAVSIITRVILISKAQDDFSAGKPGIVITVTDKQIINDYTRNGNSGSTEHEFIVFTDKGAYLCGSIMDEASIYGQLLKDSTYEVWTMPAMSFSYKGNIVRLRQIHK